ncbi:PepSY domain-containing protein, partial [Kitasatospora sp. NPDC059571]|uniref:PepSY domain-containing protein n=1 Tax=Kitasatospora sp. NPDC059571 TaxID=3346871 RepID=UPI00367E2550
AGRGAAGRGAGGRGGAGVGPATHGPRAGSAKALLAGADGRPGIRTAPAPLPAVAAQQAVEKAVAAVPGGRVESLAVVPEQGGGTAWEAVVVGQDGVRHRVTVDGAGGAVTGNTVMGEPAGTAR